MASNEKLATKERSTLEIIKEKPPSTESLKPGGPPPPPKLIVVDKTTREKSGSPSKETLDKDRRLSTISRRSKRASSSSSGKFNWGLLSEKIKEEETKGKEVEPIKGNLAKAELFGTKKERQSLKLFYRRCHCLFTGNMFFRHPYRIITFVEVLLPPIIALIIFLAFTSGVSWNKTQEEKAEAETSKLRFDEYGQAEMQKSFINAFGDDSGRMLILYTPDNNFTQKIMRKAIQSLKVSTQNVMRSSETGDFTGNGVIGLRSHDEVVENAILHRKESKMHRSPLGITFIYDEKEISPITKLPNNLTFAISTFDRTILATEDAHPYVPPARSKDWQAPYHKSGFLGIQYEIERAYLQVVAEELAEYVVQGMKDVDTNDPVQMRNSREALKLAGSMPDPNTYPGLKLKMVSHPNFYTGTLRTLIKIVTCLTIVIAYSFLSYFIVKQIVIEHESGIKDILKFHGLPTYVHWIVLGTHAFLFRTITAIGVTISLFVDYGHGALFEHSNSFVVFILIWTHVLALTSFNFLFANTLSSVAFSGVYSVSLCFLTYFIPLTLWNAELMPRIPNFIVSVLFPNWAFVNGVVQLVEHECDGQGVDWDILTDFTDIKVKNMLRLSETVIVLAYSTILYFALAVLEDMGRRKKLSMSNKWYHFIERCQSIRHKRKLKASHPKSDAEAGHDYEKPAIYEELVTAHKSIVKVRNLTKLFGEHKLVLDNISMDFGNGEITVILGHAGSGKSTFVLCLSGMLIPTSGYCSIKGYNVHTDTRRARHFMGLCPEELILFNLLTVNQHLVLCYRLRGLRLQDANRQAGQLLHLLRLHDVRNRKPSFLTKNERRKLVIAMCLVDAPAVILLDEPTLEMDGMARREIWDILKNLKKEGHTIILSTNMIDEAEYLADRIALIAHGKLVCYGSTRYLKNRYDTGYVLKIIPDKLTFNMEDFNKLAKEHLGENLTASMKKAVEDRDNVLLELPHGKTDKFPGLFDQIDTKKEGLGILSYDVQHVSLCDIFIKICESLSAEAASPDVYLRKNSKDEYASALAHRIPSIPSEENFETRVWHHLAALFHKRWICTINRKAKLFWEYFIPLLLVLLTAWNSEVFVNSLPKPEPKQVEIKDFPGAKVYTRMASELPSDSPPWSELVGRSLGSHEEKLLPRQAILSTIREDLKRDSESPQFTIEKRMIALELRNNPDEFVGYYSSASLHSPALILNIISNIYLNRLRPNDSYHITVVNAPFPTHLDKPFNEPCDVRCLIFAVIISFACGMFLAALIPFPIRERRNGMKQMQLMTGVHPITYWLSQYLFDVVISVCLVGAIYLFFSFETHKSYDQSGVQSALLITMMLFLCVTGMGWTYFLSTVLPLNHTGYNLFIWIHIVLGIIPTIILEVLLLVHKTPFVNALRWCFNFFPPYVLTLILYRWFHAVTIDRTCNIISESIPEICEVTEEHTDLYNNDVGTQKMYKYVIEHDVNLRNCCPRICEATGTCNKFVSLLSFGEEDTVDGGIVGNLIALAAQGLFYWALLIISEKKVIERMFQSVVYKYMQSQEKRRRGKAPSLRPDIRSERDRVSTIISKGRGNIPDETALICQDLTKSDAAQMIINNVNLEVRRGECVSLLGGGGSGKTTVMQMLSGGIIPTRGTVFIGNTNLHKERKKYLSNIGYCPQTNCLFDSFTGIQMLNLMGRLKGVPRKFLPSHIKKWLQILGLLEAGHDKCITYSESMKRRLCGAMALIGGNPIILLDEPTTGVDALGRQRFWAVIKLLTLKGHSVVFTSYNVEECAALSSRIIVLSEGNVQCVGTPDELRDRFARGFSLLLRIRFDSLTPVELVSSNIGRLTELKLCVERKFKHVTLRDEQDNLLLYFLRDTRLSWGELFRKAEEIKNEFSQILEKYFISRASLDDIFILLTNKHRELDRPRRMNAEPDTTGLPTENAVIEAATKALNK